MSEDRSASNIDQESEDLFATPEEEEEEVEQREPTEEAKEGKKEGRKDGSELTAAAALTSLAPKPSEKQNEKEGEKGADKEKEEEFVVPERFTKSGRKRAVPFPIKLMKVLNCKEYNDIICWMPSGESFTILRPKIFTSTILPVHFKSAKYSSFTRKLHRWGFMRHYRGEEAGAFFHKYFKKGRLDLVEKMTCHTQDSNKSSSAIHGRKERSASAPTGMSSQMHHMRVPMPVKAMSLQHQQPLAQNVHRLSGGAPGGGMGSRPADLNAAIEMEVARRLKERINAAAVSRQALALMQQQMKMPMSPQQQQQQQLQQQQQQLQQQQLQQQQQQLQQQQQQLQQQLYLQGAASNLGQPSATAMAMARQGLVPAAYGKYEPSMGGGASSSSAGGGNYATTAFGADVNSLPMTNIQGAKTA